VIAAKTTTRHEPAYLPLALIVGIAGVNKVTLTNGSCI
jgi:hypothetical protein